MRERLAQTVGVLPFAVNVKFTTNEGMGFVGRGEGIAALAVATLHGR
jgi:2C-methyl-D-erythritol 2,4-cyclodiphosphate synthase